MKCNKKCKVCSVEHLCTENIYWYNPKPMTLGTLTLTHDYKLEVEQSKKYWRNEK